MSTTNPNIKKLDGKSPTGPINERWSNHKFHMKIVNPANKRKYKDLSWAELPHTINEAGSTYTVQVFDLNYAGVIISPSVKFRDGKVVFDRSSSQNKKAIRQRTLLDGSKSIFLIHY